VQAYPKNDHFWSFLHLVAESCVNAPIWCIHLTLAIAASSLNLLIRADFQEDKSLRPHIEDCQHWRGALPAFSKPNQGNNLSKTWRYSPQLKAQSVFNPSISTTLENGYCYAII